MHNKFELSALVFTNVYNIYRDYKNSMINKNGSVIQSSKIFHLFLMTSGLVLVKINSWLIWSKLNWSPIIKSFQRLI